MKSTSVRLATVALALSLSALSSLAQPSGGPYGPIAQTYALPTNAAHLYYVAPDGKADAAGTSLAEPTTLEAVIPKVVTGDAIILRGGTYRTGNLLLNQGITLQPYADERPILKGTEIADKWEPLREGVWRTSWKKLFPTKPADWWRRNREGMRTPLHRFNNDMVFVDGRPLQSAGWEGELDANSYSIDYEKGHVFIKFDPKDRVIEITAHDSAIMRTITDVHGKKSDRKGPTLRGLTFTQYAYRALEIEGTEPEARMNPADFGKEVTGTTIEHVTITHSSRVGGYFHGDHFTMRHCLISDTSTEGLYLVNSSDCLLEKNIFARNNVEKITGYYPSAVKIFNQTHRVTCRDNLVIDNPNSNGIWYDVGNVDGVFVNNWVEGCEDGFFFEISKGAICAGNVFVNCHKGIRILNSSGVQVYNNTFVNTTASFERTERSAVGDHFGWHPATGPDIEERINHVFANNLLVADETFAKELLRFEQPALLKPRLALPHTKEFNHNVYVRRPHPANKALIAFSPAPTDTGMADLAAPADVTKLFPQFETNSRVLPAYYGPLFKSLALQRFELLKSFPATGAAAPLPEPIRVLLGWPKGTAPFPGAYAPVEN